MASGTHAVAKPPSELPVPYVAYCQLHDLLVRLPDEPLPDRLSGKALGVSPQIGSRLVTALRFLGMINAASEPTLELQRFVRSQPPERRRQLAGIIAARYTWILQLPTPTPYGKFLELLKLRCGYQNDTLKRAAAFVLTAAQDLGVELPVPAPPRGRPIKRTESSYEVGESRPGVTYGQEGRVARYFDLLMREAERNAKKGLVDRDILDRIDRLVGVGRDRV